MRASPGRARPWRLIVALAIAGAALGFFWGIADEPRYTSTASLVAVGRGGESVDPEAMARLAIRGGSEEVATLAAGTLGDDVAGADLLSEVEIEPGIDAGTLDVVATSELPDFAAATANAFSEALAATTEGGGASGAIRLIGGAAAEIPSDPSENRPAATWSAGGLLAGLLAGALAGLLMRRRGRDGESADFDARDGEAAPAAALAPALATIDDPESLVLGLGPGSIRLDPEEATTFRRIAKTIGLGEADAPRTLTVLDAAGRGDADVVATALAVAGAEIGLRVVIVEADLAAPSLAGRLRVDGAPGLRDYLDGRATPRNVLRQVGAEIEGESVPLVCVPAGELLEAVSGSVAGARFEDLVERLPRVYDLVVFEGPPLLAEEDAAYLARIVDGVVLVAADGEHSRPAIERSARTLASEPVLGLVLTRRAPPGV